MDQKRKEQLPAFQSPQDPVPSYSGAKLRPPYLKCQLSTQPSRQERDLWLP